MPSPRKNLITTKPVFIVSLIVMLVVIAGVWLTGVREHRSLYANALLSVSLLSVAFFLFLFVGLYTGSKLKDNIGKLTRLIRFRRFTDKADGDTELVVNSDPDTVGDSIGEIVISIVLWLLATFVVQLLFFALAGFVWALILIMIGMLYWIFFRAIRLVFRQSPKCRDNLWRSLLVAVSFTVLYSSWVYCVIIISHVLRN